TILSHNNKQLQGHGKDYHKDGFSSPVGKLKGRATPLEAMTAEELNLLGIETGKLAELNFENGITVRGTVKQVLTIDGKNLIITFNDCTVKDETGSILFDPSWGVYDMAIGESIVSVFCGAADKDAYEEIT